MYEDKSLRAVRRSASYGLPAAASNESVPGPFVCAASLACIPPPGPDICVPPDLHDHVLTAGPKRLLLVDDDPQNLAVFARLIAPLGHDVVLASSGRSAVVKFTAYKPDLVLVDLVMPGLSGLDVLAHIRENDRDVHVPVIVLTGHSEPEHKARGLEAGADDFLEKPFDGYSLRSRVTTLLQLRAARDELRRLKHELLSQHTDDRGLPFE